MAIEDSIQKLVEKRDLTAQEAEETMEALMSGKSTDAQNAGFLVALRMKEETPQEIASMAKVMRKYAATINPRVDGMLVDTCGTGGDRKGTINVSTTAMLVVAGAGVPVAKHGNRSVSSQCGSADVLEALGVKVDLTPEQVQGCIEEVGVGFMFAPVFHKAMKNVIPARKQLGIRTAFNVLGPLTNPANAQGQVMGVFDESLTQKMAEVLKLLGVQHAFVVYGLEGLDEISVSGETKVSELRDGTIEEYTLKPEDAGMKRADIKDIKGGSRGENAQILRRTLEGKVDDAMRDVVVLNAAAAIMAGGKTLELKKAVKLAEKAIDDGSALEKLDGMIEYCRRA